MILRNACWIFFLLLVFGKNVNTQVTVDDKGYQNVLISFAPNIPSKDGESLIKEIQGLLEKASSVLHTAIGIPIASVTFHLPPSWSTETWENITLSPPAETQAGARPDIFVDGTEESPFRNQPVSLQYAGCGVPGHQIILNRDFINDDRTFPKGKLLAREWLKYRYGVFDESGFNGDVLFPNFHRVPGKSEVRIAECTHPKATYVFKRLGHKGSCNMDTSDYFFCTPEPDENSAANVTSSLMFYHKNLPNMVHICGKDGHQHNADTFNKQNAQCNGRSIWDVIKQSEDFKKTRKQSSPKSIQFSYIQESKPNLVVLLENSDNLHEKEIPSLIHFALRRLYYDLPSKRKLGIYTYNSDVTAALPYAELPAGERSDLRVIADFGLPAKNVCTSCGLARATEILLQDGDMKKGLIFLITSSALDKVPELSKKLIDSGTCLYILRFTSEQNPDDQSYDPLAHSFHCFSQRRLQNSLDSLITFDSLFNFLDAAVPIFGENSEIKKTVTGEMSGALAITITRDPSASLYTLWLNKILGSSSIECKTGETVIELKSGTAGTDISSFTFDPVDDNVTCKFASDKQDPVLYQVQTTAQLGSYFSSVIWIHDKSTDKVQLPILIYASIYYGGYPVKNANVKTVVTFGNKKENVEMIDNGRGDPDITKGDGIYSGYFSNFSNTGTYEINVMINDNDGKATAGKESESEEPIACCGSRLLSEDFDIPAFRMVRVFLYNAKNKRPEDGYPPSKIIDLQVVKVREKVGFVWSSPGGGKAAKYILKLFRNRNDAIAKFDTTGQELDTSSKIPGAIGKRESIFSNISDFEEDVTYYAAIRSLNEFNKQSEISNVVEFVANPKATTTTQASTTDDGTTDNVIIPYDPPKSDNHTIAIVFGIVGGTAVLCILGYLGRYYYLKRTRRS